MKIVVVEHDPMWKEKYEKEAAKITDILKDILVSIDHIGSTSVEGLAAKPIIDILPVVTDIKKVDAYNAEFRALGYECMGEFGISGRRYFRKGGEENRTFHVHVFGQESTHDIRRHLAVRDYLRSHKEEADAYGELKKKLAAKFTNDIDGYCDGKDVFVKELEKKSLAWYETSFKNQKTML